MIPGSVVTLKSGGPRMTVQDIRDGKIEAGEEAKVIKLVKCIHIDQMGNLTRPIFPMACLEEVFQANFSPSSPMLTEDPNLEVKSDG